MTPQNDPTVDLKALHRLYGATNAYVDELHLARESAARLRAKTDRAGYVVDGIDCALDAQPPVTLGTIAQLQQALIELLFVERQAQNASRTIRVGSRVRIQDEDDIEEFEIVEAAESDATAQRISPACPLGRAVVGHRAGETVRVRAPGSVRDVMIISVE